jgi:ATP synthase protein I
MAEPDDDQAKLDALRNSLSRRNAEKRASEAAGPTEAEQEATRSSMSMAVRAAGEMAASIVVGGLIGWQTDRWLGTKPAFLITFFLLGAVGGVWNIIRATSPKRRPIDHNSRLSDGAPPDKDVRRSAPSAETGALRGADDDED